MTSPHLTMTLDDNYLRVLTRAARGQDGKIWEEGSRVIANPLRPGEFRNDTPENRERFAREGFGWTDACRAEWFEQATIQLRGSQSFVAAVEARERYLKALDANLTAAIGSAFPFTHLPSRARLLPWSPRVRQVTAAVLDRHLVDLIAEGTVPSPLRDRARTLLHELVALRLYRLRGPFGQSLQIVVSFVAAADFSRARVTATATPLELVKRALASECSDHWFAIGCVRDYVKPQEPQFQCAYATPDDRHEWSVLPANAGPRSHLEAFAERLLPVTVVDNTTLIKRIVDSYFVGVGGRLTPDVRERDLRSDLRRQSRELSSPALRAAMIELQASGYAVRRNTHGELAIRPSSPGEPVLATGEPQTWTPLTRLAFSTITPSIFLASAMLRDYLCKGQFEVDWVVVALPIVIITGWLTQGIERLSPPRNR